MSDPSRTESTRKAPEPGARGYDGARDDDAPSREPDPDEAAPLPRADCWLVDGYNVLNTSAFRAAPSSRAEPDDRWWSREQRERLVTLARCFPDPDAEVWIVFDGARPAQPSPGNERPGVRVEFAPSADDWIVRRVRSAQSPSTIAVVTRDRQVAGRIEHRGAQAVWPLRFIRACGGLPSATDEP